MKHQIDSKRGSLASKTARVGTFSVLALLGAALAGGCSMETAQEDEELGEINAELGELRCAEQACIASNSCDTVFAPLAQCDYAVTSVVDFVPYGTFGCPQQSTAFISAPTGTTLQPYIGWGDTPLTEAQCPSGKLDLTVYRRPNSTAAWTSKIYRLHGVWRNHFPHPPLPYASCEFVPNDGYTYPDIFQKGATDQVRLAGSAKVGSNGYRAVVLGAVSGTGACK